MLATRTGSHVVAAPSAEFIERRLSIQEDGNDEEELRRLVETPLGTILLTQSEAAALLAQYTDGHSVTGTVEFGDGDTTVYFSVEGISSFTNGLGDTCDVYNDVEVLNSGVTTTIRVECCPGDDYCLYYFAGQAVTRHRRSTLSVEKL